MTARPEPCRYRMRSLDVPISLANTPADYRADAPVVPCASSHARQENRLRADGRLETDFELARRLKVLEQRDQQTSAAPIQRAESIEQLDEVVLLVGAE